MEIIGVDWGGAGTKLANAHRVEHYPSDIIPYRNIMVENDLRRYDFIFEYGDRKGVAGTLARDERTSLDSNRRGDSKFHEDALIRLLIGIHQFSASNNVKVVVGQPLGKHSAEKELIREMLVDQNHVITVNGTRKTIDIQDARVGAEGASAFFATSGLYDAHIIDLGSGTINLATMRGKRLLNSKSTTIPRGLENLGQDYANISEAIRNRAIDLEWDFEGTPVKLVGGGARVMRPYLANIFRDCEILHPIHNGKTYGPELANAIGFYTIGVSLWGSR